MMNEKNVHRLRSVASAERFEKWLDDNEERIDTLLSMPAETWTLEDVLYARAVIASQRAVLRVEQVKRSERQWLSGR